MTIEEMHKAKHTAEDKIRLALQDFEQETGLIVDDIKFRVSVRAKQSDGSSISFYEVDLDARL